MKKAIIGVVVLLVLGGGGYFGWLQMNKSTPEFGEQKGESSFFSNDEPKFVELDLLTAPFVKGGGKFVQYVVLVVILEVASDDGVDEVRAVIPRLRDAFVTDLHTLATMRNPEQKMLNMPRIKSRLLASARKVMRSDTVRAVLVQLAQ
jgi:flagellar basal body-associated protein FliL